MSFWCAIHMIHRMVQSFELSPPVVRRTAHNINISFRSGAVGTIISDLSICEV